MNPTIQPNTQSDGFKPKWRHFPPQATLWLQNPFDHDVVFKVADELGRQFQYRLPKGKVSELPGGAVATLGLKHVVDEMIQNSHKEGTQSDLLSIWDANVRLKYEDKVILREKSAPAHSEESATTGEIDLGVKPNSMPDEPLPTLSDTLASARVAPEPEFPGLAPAPVTGGVQAAPIPANPDIAATLGSLPDVGQSDANNAGHTDE